MNRIHVQQALVILFFLMACLIQPRLGEWVRDQIYVLGLICLLISVVGRTWCTTHIGSIKDSVVVRSGPYGLCRNPLYLFSLFGASGFGLLHGSLIFFAVIISTWLLIVLREIKSEEQSLAARFGEAYQDYLQSVPRLLPVHIANWKTLSLSRLEKTRLRPRLFIDSLLILLLIPLAELARFIRVAGDLALWQLL